MPSTGLKKSIEMKRAVNPENREKEDIEKKTELSLSFTALRSVGGVTRLERYQIKKEMKVKKEMQKN